MNPDTHYYINSAQPTQPGIVNVRLGWSHYLFIYLFLFLHQIDFK